MGRGVQSGGAVSEGDRMASPYVFAEGALKGLNVWALGDEWLGEHGADNLYVRLVDRLATVWQKVRQDTICSEGSMARNSSAVSCTGLVSLL